MNDRINGQMTSPMKRILVLISGSGSNLTGNLAAGTAVEDGLQVAAVAGDQHQDAFHGGGHLAVDPVIH